MFSTLFSVLSAFLFLSANAVPTNLVELLAFAPNVTYPDQGTVWIAGSNEYVSWDTNDIPQPALDYTVTVLLGHLTDDSENLDTTHPLATHVPITNGIAPVSVPSDLPYRIDYIVVVIGDSGDRSSTFTIMPSAGSSKM